MRVHALAGRAQVLDSGCGAGQIVTALRAEGIAAFGCDLFQEGGAPFARRRLTGTQRL